MTTMKKFKTKAGELVSLELIQVSPDYKGFYLKFPSGETTKANYNSGAFENCLVKYSRGYEFTHGENMIEHLFWKLEEGLKLSSNELKDFYDKVESRKPIVRFGGVWYDFREVLFKLPGVQFWTLSEEPNRMEKKIYKKAPVYADAEI